MCVSKGKAVKRRKRRDVSAIHVDLLMQTRNHRIDLGEVALIDSLALQVNTDPKFRVQIAKQAILCLRRTVAGNVASKDRRGTCDLPVPAQVGLDEKQSAATCRFELDTVDDLTVIPSEQGDSGNLVVADLGSVANEDRRSVGSDSQQFLADSSRRYWRQAQL